MSRIYVPSRGPEDWQRLLADPMKHWRTGYSARSLAYCWENACAFPTEIAKLFGETVPELLLALPEHKVPLPGSQRGESQNDLFVLARVGDKTYAITVEGKVSEPFGPCVGDWLESASNGKRERLRYLCDVLGLPASLRDDIPYQLLHRTASAVIEARRFKTDAAVMIVHSFSKERMWFDAFGHFVSLFGQEPLVDKWIPIRPDSVPPLSVAWVCGAPEFLEA